MPEQRELPQQKLCKQTIIQEEHMMKTIDTHVLEQYNSGMERNRLRTGIGRIEFARTKELLLEHLPPAPATIYDIGGGYGEYAWWLASLGYEVHLFDLSETNIRMSAELSVEYPGTRLAAAEVRDARSIPRADHSADAVLLMGPLYHILERDERLAAIRESRRLLKPDSILVTAAINPYSTLLWATSVFGVKNKLLRDAPFISMAEHEIATGEHRKPEAGPYAGLGHSHFHNAAALKEELSAGGFRYSTIYGIDGGAWMVPDLDTIWENETDREHLLRTIRMLDGHEDIIGLSTHLLGISR